MKACMGDYDPLEESCDECEDVVDCKDSTPRVKVRRNRV